MFGEGGLGSPLLTIGTFVAFNTALGQFLAGATSATETFVRIIDNVNKVALLEPILQTDPETDATPGSSSPSSALLAAASRPSSACSSVSSPRRRAMYSSMART